MKNAEEYLAKNSIKKISINDEAFPESLRNIYEAPQILYTLGNVELLREKGIAVIGARMCSAYGRKVAEEFSFNLAKNGICIISGLARGIDTASHIGALKANGKTIAVLGSGIDIIYPTENKTLTKNILLNGGLIVSEYPLGTRPIAENFPRRNRIISGLSNGVLVVEAKQRSGTFITVDFALEQGREVYAVPGNISSVVSAGTNELIKQGAKLVTSVEDILEDFC